MGDSSDDDTFIKRNRKAVIDSESDDNSSSSSESSSSNSSSGESSSDESPSPPQERRKQTSTRTRPTPLSKRRTRTRDSGKQESKVEQKRRRISTTEKRSVNGKKEEIESNVTPLSDEEQNFHRMALGLRNTTSSRRSAPTRSQRSVKRVQQVLSEDEEEEEEEDDEEEEEEEEGNEEEEFDEEIVQEDVDVPETDGKEIEKIIAHKFSKDSEAVQYLIKWKNRSYLHVSWEPESTLEVDNIAKRKLQRYLKSATNPFVDGDEEFLYGDYCQIDRIIAKKSDSDGIRYLVKWQSLPYADATWETAADIQDDDALLAFTRRERLPKERKPKKPDPKTFVPLEESPTFRNDNKLRPYQLEGLNWMLYNWHHGRNSVLADEMGLGKTVQTVVVAESLRESYNIDGPHLVIAPLSTIGHWKREFEGWTEFNVVVYHGSAESRKILRNYEWFHRDSNGKKLSNNYKFSVLITTYEMMMTDRSVLQSVPWYFVAVDEAHRLKNKSCKLAGEMRTLKYRSLLFLTGTPIQNNIEELFTLMSYIDYDKFGDPTDFLDKFGDLKDAAQVEELHKMLKPYLLRRMKENVEKSIAPKEETIIEVELTTIQKKYYRAIYEKNFQFLNRGTTTNNVPSLLNIMIQLRKCCNHPYLIEGVEDTEVASVSTRDEAFQKLIQASGKMVLVDKLLPKLKAGGHKVLIFSQMVRVLDLLEDYLNYRGYSFERLDGGIRGTERQQAIDRFSKGTGSAERFVFLLSTRAGGLGINLTAADTVIIFDSDWNPQNDIQAQARAHRIGQTQMVKVYRLLTKNTYEWEMFDRSSKKLGLDKAVLSKINGSKDSSASTLDKKTIDSLLKRGAYDLLRETDDNFDEEDIDTILNRSKTIVHKADEGLSTFSKASFSSATSAPELDIHDPLFWTKLFPTASTADPRIQIEPRERKKVSRFGIDEPMGDSDSDEDGADSDVEFQLEPETEKESQPLEGSGEWTIGERNRFRAALQQLGYGRWGIVSRTARLTRSPKALQRFAAAMLRRCTLPAAMLNDLLAPAAPTDPLPPPDSPLLTEPVKEENQDVQMKTEDQVKAEDQVKTETKDEMETETTEPNNAEESKETTAMNIDSVSNSVSDSNAIQAAQEPIVIDEDEKTDVKVEESESKEKKKKPKKEEEELAEMNERVLQSDEWEEWATVKARTFLRRVAVAGRVARALENVKRPEEVPVPLPELPEGDWPDWSVAQDQALLLGAYWHGIGRLAAIRDDPFLWSYFTSSARPSQSSPSSSAANDVAEPKSATEDHVEGAKETKEEEETTKGEPKDEKEKSGWGHPERLVSQRQRRMVRLAEAWQRNREKAAKTAAKEERRAAQAAEWSKREKGDVYRVIVQHGVPTLPNGDYNFQFIKERANLKRKSLEMIEEFYIQFLTQCRLAVSNSPDTKYEDFTQMKYQRAVQRIMLFSKLRTEVLPNRKLTKRLKKAIRTPDLPRWWNPEIHDKGLLEGVDIHGFGQWEEICKDKNLPFFEQYQKMGGAEQAEKEKEEKAGKEEKADSDNEEKEETKETTDGVDHEDEEEKPKAEEKPDEKKGKGKKGKKKPKGITGAINFPKDRICMKRLEYTMNLVTAPKSKKLKVASTSPGRQTTLTEYAERTSPGGGDQSSEGPGKRTLEGDEKEPPKKRRKKKEGKKETDNVKRYTALPTDSEGNVKFPISLGVLTVNRLGTVKPHPKFHTGRYIWPVNFQSSRMYFSMKDPEKRTLYTCDILDDNDQPCFQLTAEDDPGNPIKANSPTAAWKMVLEKVNQLKTENTGKRQFAAVSGPEYFGFAHPSIAKLIQELPGVDQCEKYVKKEFIQGKKSAFEEPSKKASKKPKLKFITVSPGDKTAKSESVESNMKTVETVPPSTFPPISTFASSPTTSSFPLPPISTLISPDRLSALPSISTSASSPIIFSPAESTTQPPDTKERSSDNSIPSILDEK